MSQQRKYDTTATEVAEVFQCSDSYVRKVVTDSTGKYKGERAKNIRLAYWRLKNGKNRLLQSVTKLVPFPKKAS